MESTNQDIRAFEGNQPQPQSEEGTGEGAAAGATYVHRPVPHRICWQRHWVQIGPNRILSVILLCVYMFILLS